MAYRNAPIHGLSVKQMKLIVKARNTPGVHAYYPDSHYSLLKPIRSSPPSPLMKDTTKIIFLIYASLAEPPAAIYLWENYISDFPAVTAFFKDPVQFYTAVDDTIPPQRLSHKVAYENGVHVFELDVRSGGIRIESNGEDVGIDPSTAYDLSKNQTLVAGLFEPAGHIRLWEYHETDSTQLISISTNEPICYFLNQWLIPGCLIKLTAKKGTASRTTISYNGTSLLETDDLNISLTFLVYLHGYKLITSAIYTAAPLTGQNMFVCPLLKTKKLLDISELIITLTVV